jgi:hypothetical protein
MNRLLADLVRLLDLERLEQNLFRGESRDIGSPQVFGGQVLGQALMAASRTVEGRLVHSLHAYFLRRGDFDAPIIYEVDRSRDGGSFTSRRVVAIQHGQQIFHMSASFQVEENGPDHQVPMPDVPPPDQLPDMTAEVRKSLDGMPAERRRFWSLHRPFEYRSVEPVEAGGPRPGVRHLCSQVGLAHEALHHAFPLARGVRHHADALAMHPQVLRRGRDDHGHADRCQLHHLQGGLRLVERAQLERDDPDVELGERLRVVE